MNGIFFVKDGTVARHSEADVAFDSRLSNFKIKTDTEEAHVGSFDYTFKATPPDGEIKVFEIKHGYDYTPSALVRINQKGSPLTRYLTHLLSAEYFDPFPFPALQEWVWYYRCDENYFRVYYTQTNGNGGDGNPYANTIQQVTYEIYANPGNQLLDL